MSDTTTMPESLAITADVAIDLQAGAGKAKKRPTFSIVAYTGGPMNVDGFYQPVVLELTGIKAAPRIPVLLNHELQHIVGQGSADVSTRGVTVAGTITGDDGPALTVVSHAKNGFQWQASIGARIDSREFLEAGRTAVVNGRTVTGPLLIARKSTLKEVSIVGLGADDSTSATIAAHARETDMSKPNDTTPPTVPAAGETITAQASELVRAKLVNQYIGEQPEKRSEFEQLEVQAQAQGWDAGRFELELVRAARPIGPANIRTGDAGGGGGLNRESLQASIMLRVGQDDLAVKAFGERHVESARRMHIGSLVDLCRAAIRMQPSSRGEAALHDHTDAMIRAAFSTTTLPNILANTMGRTLEAAYLESTSDLRGFVTIKSAANFKPQEAIRPSALQALQPIGAGGEIQHSDIKEEDKYPWSVGTFARMCGISRTEIINDDLSFFDTIPALLASAAARALLDLFWSTIIGGETAGHYSVQNGNFLDAGSALGITSLALAVQTMREQKDARGDNINIVPRVLAVSALNETNARTLLNSTEIVAVTSETTPSGNPVKGIVDKLVVDARLSNTDKFELTAANEWYLFGGPQSSAVLLGFLQGRQTPIVESEDAEFDKLGMQVRCYHDFGVALGDPKASLKATGAAGGG